jgi:type VI secretion system secreted protein Hcp
MTVEGEKQGNIEGSCDIKGKEKTVLVYALEHKVHMPRDPQSGLPSGKRVHSPLIITKEYDKASPKLYQALCSGEHLKKVEIKYFRIDKQGKEEHYFTQTLEDAIVVTMEPYVPVVFVKDNEPFRHMEKVGFTYAKIKWLWNPDGVESEDSWRGA